METIIMNYLLPTIITVGTGIVGTITLLGIFEIGVKSYIQIRNLIIKK